MTFFREAAAVAAKDLRLEARTRVAFGQVAVLGVLIVVVLAMGLGPGSSSADAPAILWVAYLFGGGLCFERTMAVERYDSALSGLLLSPIDRGAIFAGKLGANLAVLLALAAVVTPVGVVLFHFDLSAAPLAFAGITALGLLGYAAIGTLFSALVSSVRQRGGLLALLVFPLSLPLVVVSTQLSRRLLVAGDAPMTGLPILVAFDVVFLVAGWLAFETALEP